MPSRVEIELTATGAAAVSKVFDDVAKKSRAFAEDLTTGSKGINSALGSTTKSLTEVSNLMGQAGVNTGILGQALGALSSPFGIAAAGAVALGLALKQTVDYMRQNYEQLRQLQAVSGLAADEADQLADAWELLGGNAQALTTSLFKMGSEIQTGGKNMRDLGVSIRDAAGNLKTEGDLFLEVRDKISALGTASQRNAALMEIFGRSGREMAAIFALSEAEFRKWLETAGKIGPSASESMRVTEDYSRATAELSKHMSALTETMGIKLLPILAEIARSITAAIKWSDAWSEAIQKQIGGLKILVDLWEQYKQFQRTLGIRGPEAPPPPTPPIGSEMPGAGGGGFGKLGGEIKVVTDELAKMREQLEVMRANQLDQPIVKLEQAFRAFAEKAGPAATAEFRTLTNEAIALTRATQAIPDQLAALKKLADEGIGDLKTAGLLLELKDIDDTLKDLTVTLGESRDKVLLEAQAMRELAEAEALAAEALKEIGPLAEALSATFDPVRGTLVDLNRELRALQATTELDAAAIRAFGVSFRLLDEAQTESLLTSRAWSAGIENLKGAKAFEETLKNIALQAQLLGPAFDAVQPTITALTNEIIRLGKAGEDVSALQEQLAGLRQFQDLRGMFEGIFSSVGSALNTLVQGVILGTSTMADAFKRLGQSIVIEFVNRVLQQALNPLMKAAAAVVAGLFSPAGAGAGGVSSSFGGAPEWAMPGVGNGGGGGGGFDFGSIPIPNISTLTNLYTGVTNAWTAFNVSLDVGNSAMTAFSDAASTFSTAFQGASSALGVATAGIAAAYSVYDNIMAGVNGRMAEFGLRLGLGVAGGVAGGLLTGGSPIGILAGVSIGDFVGKMLSKLFGVGPTEGEIKRIQAADAANRALGNLTLGFEDALKAFNSQAVLTSLQAGGAGGSGNSVRTELVLPTALATQIGIAGQDIGNRIVAQWSSITLEQFEQVIKAFQASPSLIDQVRGSGDVPYLDQGEAAQFADQIQNGARALLRAFAELSKVSAEINKAADGIIKAAQDFLPADFETVFSGQINSLRNQMLDVIFSEMDPDDIKDQLNDLQEQLKIFAQIGESIAAATRTVTTLGNIAEIILPPDLAAAVVAQIQDFRAQMLAALSSGLGAEEIQEQVNKLAESIQAFAGLAQLYATTSQDIAKLAGDIAGQTEGAVLAIVQSLALANQAVQDARSRSAEAITPAEMLAATAQLRDAILSRYALEMKLIQDIQANLARLLEAATGVQQILTGLAVQDLRSTFTHAPDTRAFEELYESLVNLARFAPTAAQRLFAISQGLAAVIAAIPVSSTYFANGSSINSASGAAIPAQIWQTLITQAQPFLDELAGMIGDALTGGDLQGALSLLQQEAQTLQALAQAGIQAINALMAGQLSYLAEQASGMRDDINANYDLHEKNINADANANIARIEATRDAQVKAYEAEIDAIEKASDLKIKGYEKEIDAIGAAAKARQEAISLEIDSLQAQQAALGEMTASAREWEGVAKSAGDFLTELHLGPQAPLNPADQLALARSNFADVQAAFNANPTAAGASDVQRAAQSLLDLGQDVLTRPSPEYQELFASVVSAMERVQGLAAGMAPASADDLEAQTKALSERIAELQDESKRVGDAADQQVAGLRDLIAQTRDDAAEQIDATRVLIEQAREDAANQIDFWNNWRTVQLDIAATNRAHDLALVDEWEQAQEAAIRATAQEQADAIGETAAAALRANAAEQNRILGILVGAQLDQLNALTGGVDVQLFLAERANQTVLELEQLNRTLGAFLDGIPGNAEGDWNSSGGLRVLHPGEMVIPHTPADLLRRGGGFQPVAGGRQVAPVFNITVNAAPGANAREIGSEVERAAERVVERMARSGLLAAMSGAEQ